MVERDAGDDRPPEQHRDETPATEAVTCARCARAPRGPDDRITWVEIDDLAVCPGCLTLSETTRRAEC